MFFCIIFSEAIQRPIHPQFTFIFFILWLIFLWKILSENIFRKYIIYNFLLGILVGLLLYMYPYYWTTILAIYGTLIIYKIIKNKTNIWGLFIFLFSFLITSIPYFLNLHEASLNIFYSETLSRIGLFYTHFPTCYYNTLPVIFTLLLVIVFRSKIRDHNKMIYSLSLLFTALLINWQNLITGKYILFSTHYYMVTAFLVITVIFIAINNLNNEFKIKSAFYLILLIIPLFYFSANNINHFKNLFSLSIPKEETNKQQEMKDIFDWLNSNTPKDSILYIMV